MATTPRDDLATHLQQYHHEMVETDEDPEAILDRHFSPDVEHWNDGICLDRARLVAHRPTRKNVVRVRTDVHEVLVSGDRAAARYTLEATMRRGPTVVNDVYLFASFADDGRIRRIDQITRSRQDG